MKRYTVVLFCTGIFKNGYDFLLSWNGGSEWPLWELDFILEINKNKMLHLSLCEFGYSPLLTFLCCLPEPEHELFLVYGKGRPGIIRGMDMGAKVPDEHMIPIENLMNPRALDFHAETGFIYFADTTSYLIGRQKIDGTDRETVLKDGRWPTFGLVNSLLL